MDMGNHTIYSTFYLIYLHVAYSISSDKLANVIKEVKNNSVKHRNRNIKSFTSLSREIHAPSLPYAEHGTCPTTHFTAP